MFCKHFYTIPLSQIMNLRSITHQSWGPGSTRSAHLPPGLRRCRVRAARPAAWRCLRAQCEHAQPLHYTCTPGNVYQHHHECSDNYIIKLQAKINKPVGTQRAAAMSCRGALTFFSSIQFSESSSFSRRLAGGWVCSGGILSFCSSCLE